MSEFVTAIRFIKDNVELLPDHLKEQILKGIDARDKCDNELAEAMQHKESSGGKYLIGLGEIFDRLCSLHIKMSILESKVKNPKITDEEAGQAARLIRKFNMERTAIKSAINQRFGQGFEDFKVEYWEALEGEDTRLQIKEDGGD